MRNVSPISGSFDICTNCSLIDTDVSDADINADLSDMEIATSVYCSCLKHICPSALYKREKLYCVSVTNFTHCHPVTLNPAFFNQSMPIDYFNRDAVAIWIRSSRSTVTAHTSANIIQTHFLHLINTKRTSLGLLHRVWLHKNANHKLYMTLHLCFYFVVAFILLSDTIWETNNGFHGYVKNEL